MTIYHFIQYCFFGFGVYNLTYIILKKSKKLQEKIKFPEIDKAAITTVLICGAVYLTNWIYDWVIILNNRESESSIAVFERLDGPYGFSVYFQQVLYLSACFCFLLKFVRKYLILRFFIGFLFLFNLERFVIIITSLHRDYLPSSWTMYQNYYHWLIIDWLVKTIIFISFTTITYFIQNHNKS